LNQVIFSGANLEEINMKYRSIFDIIGPVMIGPSSSHTAGPVRIGQLARNLFERVPDEVVKSIAETENIIRVIRLSE
jgi:L-serine deaminase